MKPDSNRPSQTTMQEQFHDSAICIKGISDKMAALHTLLPYTSRYNPQTGRNQA
jgi:hypothetical protein